eukprot:749395-Hanusia_phi.AAC.1
MASDSAEPFTAGPRGAVKFTDRRIGDGHGWRPGTVTVPYRSTGLPGWYGHAGVVIIRRSADCQAG